MTALTHRAAAGAVETERTESRFRIAAASVSTLFWLILLLGVTWDVQWHSDVGPDSFWTAPHTAMYSGVAVNGLLALYVVVATTLKYRRGAPGVTDQTTTRWLGFLRAPLGFIIVGFGALGFLLFGGFDEFWHSLYGFDVTLWSPPHIGLVLSATAGSLGAVYAVASEINRARLRGDEGLERRLGLLFLAAVAVTAAIGNFLLPDTFMVVPVTGPFSTFPLIAAALYGTLLMLAASFLRRPWAATQTAVAILLLRLVGTYAAPVLVGIQAQVEGLGRRPDAVGYPFTVLAIPATLLLAGLIIDLILRLTPRLRLAGHGAAALATSVGLTAALMLERPWERALKVLPWTAPYPAVRDPVLALHAEALLPTLLATLVAAALFGAIGWRLGIFLRYTDR